MAEEKSGKIKLTVQLEVNQPLMDLIKVDVEMMANMAAQGMETWRSRMQDRGKQGHGLGMFMHHGEE